MKYVKLFEHWLLEAEGSTKRFDEMTIGEFRGASDKAEVLKNFLEQFTYVPTSLQAKESDQNLKIENVEIKTITNTEPKFTSTFFSKGTASERDSQSEEFQKEFDQVLGKVLSEKRKKEVQEQENLDKSIEKLFYGGMDVRDNHSVYLSIEDRKDRIEYYEKLKKEFSSLKDSKVLPYIEEDIKKLKDSIEFFSKKYPDGKATQAHIKFNLMLKGAGGGWDDNTYVLTISQGLKDTEANPDSAKLMDFKVDSISRRSIPVDDSISTTLGNIGLWMQNSIKTFKNDISYLKLPTQEAKPQFAGVIKNIKTYTASASKSKKK